MPKRDLLGAWGEALAAQYLQKKRYEIVAMNFRCRLGEIDVIAKNKKFLIFAEVKLRKNADFAEAREFVTAAKQARLRQTAMVFLETRDLPLQPRFDVIEIYAPEGANTLKPEIRHWEDAFS